MTTALTAGTHRLDTTNTTVRFTVKAIFGLATVHGTFDVRAGTVTVPGAQVRAELDAASFTTDNPRRDRDIRSARFLATSGYPLMTFVGTEVSPVAGGGRCAAT